MQRCWSNGTKFQLCRKNKFWRSNYSMVNIVNKYYILYLKFAKRVDLKCLLHIHTKITIWGMDMLINLIVIIISQCIHISKHHIVRYKYIYLLFVNFTYIKLETKIVPNNNNNNNNKGYFQSIIKDIYGKLQLISNIMKEELKFLI